MEHTLSKRKYYCKNGGWSSRKGPYTAPTDLLIFESAEDIHRYVIGVPRGKSATKKTQRGFNLHEWHEVLEMLRFGYAEGAAELDATLLALTKGLGEHDKDVWNMDVTGDFVDIGEYLTGAPECFMKMETIKEFGELVKIKVNACYSCGVNTRTILNRGAVVMALVDAISKTNPVELEILQISKNASKHEPEHTLDIRYVTSMEGGYSRDLVAFMLTHPDYLRRIGFAIEEILYPDMVSDGYGQVAELIKDEKDGIYFPGLTSNEYDTMGKAIDAYTKMLKPYVTDTAALE